MPQGKRTDYTDSWLRLHRERAGLSLEELAGEAGISKAFLNQIERGHRHASPDTAQALAHAIGKELSEALDADHLFPSEPCKSPREAAVYYQDLVRDEEEPTVVPEEEFEHDIDKLDNPAHQTAYERYWAKQDPATYEPMELMAPDGRLLREHPPASFVSAMRRARKEGRRDGGRPRAKRGARRRSNKSSSSSDDPGESEPSLAAALHGGRS